MKLQTRTNLAPQLLLLLAALVLLASCSTTKPEEPTVTTKIGNGKASIPDLNAATTVHIIDGGGGLGGSSSAEYTLQRIPGQFAGPGVFSMGSGGTPELKKTDNISIPLPVMQHFFATLMTSPLAQGEYHPTFIMTDSYPSISIGIGLPQDSVLIYSRSQGESRVPWAAKLHGKDYVIHSPAPADALKILAPYLHEDELNVLYRQAIQSRNKH